MRYLFILFIIILDLFAIELTSSEQEFINTHTIKCVSTSKWEPFNFYKKNHFDGIGVDYWNYVKDVLKLKSTCVIKPNWSDVLQSIQDKTGDITLATTITPDRKQYALFSDVYAKFPISIATRNDVGFIADINLLKDKKIAVGKNYSSTKLLKQHYPKLHLLEVSNINQALHLLSIGEVYAVIDIEPVLVYKINKYQYANLKIAGKTPLDFSLRFMLRDDYKVLLTAINKAIKTITDEKREMIYKKWVAVNVQNGIPQEYLYKVYLVSGLIVLLLILWAVSLLFEIKKRKALEAKLEELATIDRLTSLLNRYKLDILLEEQIEISKRYNRPLGIIFFDIDRFKNINDTFGHKFGDKVLQELSQLVLQNIRNTDFLGRWGGEEFLIILPESDLTSSILLAKKLKLLIEQYNFSIKQNITCSFGVTVFKKLDTTDSLMLRVDQLLYKAKKDGRNLVIAE